ncbi:hypothetical protein L4923_30510 [Mesorhizobium sp. IRAMC:0171]|uniref:Uncharacterized protein n=1 Tax=Mesorhizobium retamae TaxID=2912854 RepID=A0ABS9QRB5_9HYPH|nr:hypothetical protein [Mesorhizobium sp. IRAMC:0171]
MMRARRQVKQEIASQLPQTRKRASVDERCHATAVGILGAALYDPVFTGAIVGARQFTLALSCSCC